jgi:hypothetical protein
MTSKEFDQKVKEIVLKHPKTQKGKHYQFELPTILGLWSFSVKYTPRIKVAHIHSRFDGEKYSIDKFKELISDQATPSYTGKWNSYSSDPEFILDLLEETLDNFEYLKKQSKLEAGKIRNTMNYITILESENRECPNIGTITSEGVEQKFKEAIESHFDAKLISFMFIDKQIEKLDDCINGLPIDVLVALDVCGLESEEKVELSQTWLY